MIRPPTPDELPILVAQSAEIEGGDRRDLDWFKARQHLVWAVNGEIGGHTSWTEHDGYVTWDETYVDPRYRKIGVGTALMWARTLKTPGLVFGACKTDHETMIAMLTHLGLHQCQVIPGGFSDGDAILWSRKHGF